MKEYAVDPNRSSGFPELCGWPVRRRLVEGGGRSGGIRVRECPMASLAGQRANNVRLKRGGRRARSKVKMVWKNDACVFHDHLIAKEKREIK